MPEVIAVESRTVAYPNVEPSGSGPPSWDDGFPPPLTEERKQLLLLYWRAVFSGEARPEVLAIPPAVDRVVRREFTGTHSEAFWREAREEYAMRWFYGGHWVNYLDTPRGCVIISANRDEFCYLVTSIPDEQRQKTKTNYPDPWEFVE